MAIEVQIMNDVIEIVQRDSLIVIILAFSTLSLAIITTFALIVTMKSTKKSNELLEKDVNNRVRPWISFGKSQPNQVYLKGGEIVYFKEWNEKIDKKIPVMKLTFGITFINRGTLPAKNIRIKMLDKSSTKPIMKNFDNISFTDFESVLFPNEERKPTWTFSVSEWKSLEKNPMYVGILLSYDVHSKLNESTGIILKILKGTSQTISRW